MIAEAAYHLSVSVAHAHLLAARIDQARDALPDHAGELRQSFAAAAAAVDDLADRMHTAFEDLRRAAATTGEDVDATVRRLLAEEGYR